MTEATVLTFGAPSFSSALASAAGGLDDDEPAQPDEASPAVLAPARGEARLRALVARVAEQDEKALAELYDATVDRVFAIARHICRNHQAAEEVTEDVFFQVWRQALRFEPSRGAVLAWLQMLARSRALDRLRREDPAELHPEPEALAELQREISHGPQQALLAAERHRSLREALLQLGALPRQLVSLAFDRGLSHEEIAQHTGLPLGTVKSHIRRALLALREHLTASGHTAS